MTSISDFLTYRYKHCRNLHYSSSDWCTPCIPCQPQSSVRSGMLDIGLYVYILGRHSLTHWVQCYQAVLKHTPISNNTSLSSQMCNFYTPFDICIWNITCAIALMWLTQVFTVGLARWQAITRINAGRILWHQRPMGQYKFSMVLSVLFEIRHIMIFPFFNEIYLHYK